MSNTNYPNSRVYTGQYFPVMIDFNFQVASTDTKGMGITNLTGAYVRHVYMATTATPAVGNPNPAAGLIAVQLTSNFNRFLDYTIFDNSPLTGSNLAVNGSSLALGQNYVISVLGTSTLADWQAVGLPAGLTPTVGQSFIALASGHGSGSGQVQLNSSGGSGIIKYDMLGVSSTSSAPISNIYMVSVQGSWLYFRALGATNSSTTTLIAKAPADGTLVYVKVLMSNSSLTINGQ